MLCGLKGGSKPAYSMLVPHRVYDNYKLVRLLLLLSTGCISQLTLSFAFRINKDRCLQNHVCLIKYEIGGSCNQSCNRILGHSRPTSDKSGTQNRYVSKCGASTKIALPSGYFGLQGTPRIRKVDRCQSRRRLAYFCSTHWVNNSRHRMWLVTSIDVTNLGFWIYEAALLLNKNRKIRL